MKQSTIAGIEVGCTSARVCNDPRCRFNPKKASVPSQHKSFGAADHNTEHNRVKCG